MALDYFPACTHWPGVGRYARELVRALVRQEKGPELILFDVGGQRRTIAEPALGISENGRRLGGGRVRRLKLRLPRRLFDLGGKVLGLGADRLCGGVDVFHRMRPDWPKLGEARSTLAVPELPPAGSEAEAQLQRQLAEQDHLFVASQFGADELERRFSIERSRLHYVSLGCDHWLRDLDRPIERQKRILVLGALREGRRHVEILSAFEELCRRKLADELFLAGGQGNVQEVFLSRLRFSAARSMVTWMSEPDEARMPKLVAESSLMVHLSEGELSAVTPLEAFSFGVPVVVPNNGPFKEALGEEGHYFELPTTGKLDINELVRVCAEAIESSNDEQACARRRARAANYTWASSAERTVKAWTHVAQSEPAAT